MDCGLIEVMFTRILWDLNTYEGQVGIGIDLAENTVKKLRK